MHLGAIGHVRPHTSTILGRVQGVAESGRARFSDQHVCLRWQPRFRLFGRLCDGRAVSAQSMRAPEHALSPGPRPTLSWPDETKGLVAPDDRAPADVIPLASISSACAPYLHHPRRPADSENQPCTNEPCRGVRGPPFPECRALSIPCAATCGSGVRVDQGGSDASTSFCNATSGLVYQGVMDEWVAMGESRALGFAHLGFARKAWTFRHALTLCRHAPHPRAPCSHRC